MLLNLFFVALGVTLLTLGGEALIRGALALAKRLGISPLLSGLLIVGFGTSAPELVVSLDAALHGQPDIAVGNVVGSNIGNIFLILGICALIRPMVIKPLALRRDGATVVAASALIIVLARDGAFSRPDALLILACFLTYLVWAYWSESYLAAPAGEVHRAEADVLVTVPRPAAVTVLAVVGGLGLLIAGSYVLLKGAVGIATTLGVSEALIGLTLVAVGTSLPELSVCVLAVVRRHGDVAIGNILGSNIFNALFILSLSALASPLPVHTRILNFDQWVMFGAAVLLLLFLYTEHILSRIEGGILLIAYGAYIALSLTVFIA